MAESNRSTGQMLGHSTDRHQRQPFLKMQIVDRGAEGQFQKRVEVYTASVGVGGS